MAGDKAVQTGQARGQIRMHSHAHALANIHACSPEMAIGAARSTSHPCSQAQHGVGS
ncbi:hypothetical protein PAHAL_9G170400 [Panicum hallii]|uniref:Uncharacterized protein n=1 Tax=Panicum hallii TaxID=206008 RepID=A0A2T8I1G5_9POAL|nr:hypothetical protein PAHAL_9G170400 [Panicum hallii]